MKSIVVVLLLGGPARAAVPVVSAFAIQSVAPVAAASHPYAALQDILAGPDAGRIDKLRAWFENGPRFEAEVAVTAERLAQNGFRIERGLVARDAADVATTYQDLMSPGFIPRIRAWKKEDRVLDVGAGAAKALAEAATHPDFPEVEEMTAVIASDHGVDWRYIRALENTLRSRFRLYVGKLVQALKNLWENRFAHIWDSYAAITYAPDIKEVVDIAGRWLKVGGVLDTYYARHMLTFRDGARVLLPNLGIFDHEGRDVTGDWFRHIEGMEVLDETGLAKESFIAGEPYLSVQERIARAQAAGEPGITVIPHEGLTFAQTRHEQMINHTVPVALRKTGAAVSAPALEKIGFLDGRPPVRIYLWDRGVEGPRAD
jgi:SAM-dependent methyltransferase